MVAVYTNVSSGLFSSIVTDKESIILAVLLYSDPALQILPILLHSYFNATYLTTLVL